VDFPDENGTFPDTSQDPGADNFENTAKFFGLQALDYIDSISKEWSCIGMQCFPTGRPRFIPKIQERHSFPSDQSWADAIVHTLNDYNPRVLIPKHVEAAIDATTAEQRGRHIFDVIPPALQVVSLGEGAFELGAPPVPPGVGGAALDSFLNRLASGTFPEAPALEPAFAGIPSAPGVSPVPVEPLLPIAAMVGDEGAGTPPPATPDPGPGDFKPVTESMSDAARAYQEYITGHSSDVGYVVDDGAGPVKFDTFADGKLVDAKGENYDHFVDENGEFEPWFRGADEMLKAAERQTRVSGGYPITWYVAEETATNAIQQLLDRNGYGEIDVAWKPPPWTSK
jgi:hypothetical protein